MFSDAPDEATYIGWLTDEVMKLERLLPEDYCGEIAAKAHADFLNSEGIEFGDDGYFWSKEAAMITVQNYLTE